MLLTSPVSGSLVYIQKHLACIAVEVLLSETSWAALGVYLSLCVCVRVVCFGNQAMKGLVCDSVSVSFVALHNSLHTTEQQRRI